MDYAIKMVADDNGTLLVTCPDLPEVTTFGADEADARRQAAAAIEEALAARIARRVDIPALSRARARVTITLPALVTAKVELYRAARAAGISKAELGRRLKWHGPQVNRLFDLNHQSKVDQIEEALRAVGKRLVVSVDDAA